MEDIKTEFIGLRRKYIEKYFSRMNDMQLLGVTAAEGPVLILAGAGSGKTTVLVNRVASLVKFGNAYESEELPQNFSEDTLNEAKLIYESGDSENDGDIFSVNAVKPWEILAITFTNKAAGELKDRISAMLGTSSLDIWAGTFHSVCGRMLRRYGDRIGYTSHFTIYDTDDQKRLMKEVYKAVGIDEKTIPVKSALGIISNAKDSLLSPEEFAAENSGDVRLSTVGRIYRKYQELLIAADAMDFDDMIVNTVLLLKNNPDVLKYYQNKFKYIMVDEYQDTNHAQYVLVSTLASKNKNICVVGDDDQSIYRFRGATIENILSFEKQYMNARIIRLEQNYRSTSVILDAANAVIANNKERKGKNLWTNSGEGEKIEVMTANDEQGEAAFVTEKILNGVASGGAYSDNAVLYRMNAQSNAIENNLARSGIPYRVVGGHRFYDRKEIKDVIAYLNVIVNHNDKVRLARIINEPKRGIGETTLANAFEIADNTGTPIFEVLKNAADYPSLSRAAVKLRGFCDMIEEISEQVGTVSAFEIYDQVLEKSGYMLSLLAGGREEADRVENVKELGSNIVQYEKETEESSLSGFLEEVALVSDIDRLDTDADAVVLMTIHSAKGLEYENVFLVGMEEGIFPGNQSIYGGPEDIEEERRLAYVAITRAKKRLYISNAYTRMLYGQTGRNLPSRFLSEIPKELCNIKSSRSSSGFGTAEFRYGRQNGYDGYASAGRGYFDDGKNRFGSREGFGDGGFEERDASPFAKRSFGQRQASFREQSAAAVKHTAPAAPGVSYAIGEKVKHKVFGEGIILSATKMANDTLLEIMFDKAGTKKVMANFAKLEKL